MKKNSGKKIQKINIVYKNKNTKNVMTRKNNF